MKTFDTIHLSDTQKRVMLIVHLSPSGQIAYNELSDQSEESIDNFVGARDMLQQLELIDVTSDTITVTDKGLKVMEDEYLIDQTGNTTSSANELLNDVSSETNTSDDSDDFDTPAFESFDLLQQIHNQSKFL